MKLRQTERAAGELEDDAWMSRSVFLDGENLNINGKYSKDRFSCGASARLKVDVYFYLPTQRLIFSHLHGPLPREFALSLISILLKSPGPNQNSRFVPVSSQCKHSIEYVVRSQSIAYNQRRLIYLDIETLPFCDYKFNECSPYRRS